MMRRKRGSFFTFLCSLMPGAAEMYMGFMKQGISLMTTFILCIVVPSVLRLSDAFVLFAGLVWAYGFFHNVRQSILQIERKRLLVSR